MWSEIRYITRGAVTSSDTRFCRVNHVEIILYLWLNVVTCSAHINFDESCIKYNKMYSTQCYNLQVVIISMGTSTETPDIPSLERVSGNVVIAVI